MPHRSDQDEIRRRIAARSRLLDLLIAGGATFLSVSLTLNFYDDLAAAVRVLVLTLAVVHGAVLFWRRSAPWPSAAVVLVCGMTLLALGLPLVVLNLTPLVAIYSVASVEPKHLSIWAAVAGGAGLAVSQALADRPSDAGTVISNVVALVATWVIGTFVYDRQSYVAQLEERTRELQAAREDLASQAVAEERLRIARELHDVVAHSLSIIAVQSGMGAHVAQQNAAEARKALAAIEDVSRQALNEMRRLLGVLRSDDEVVAVEPAPGMDRLETLLEQVRGAGIRVDLRRERDLPSLPSGLDLVAYRVLQESLTNVIKHARASAVRISIASSPGALTLEVVDDGRGSDANGSGGHGLEGMRERVLLYGGTFQAGPMKDGGYRVRAELPLEPA